MYPSISEILLKKLRERETDGNFRKLRIRNHLIDFTSNDYLGLSRSIALKERIYKAYEKAPYRIGSTGSRLLSGNSAIAEELESYLSDFWDQEALVFNSGYDANLGIWSSVPQKADTIILDELVHACIIDGARLSGAKRERFIHNNLENLEEKLKNAAGNIFVGIESIYSMDGDQAPLMEISRLCKQYGAHLIVDEAHGTGVFGREGRGLVSARGLENEVFARVFTFGKALGVHGAAVVGKSPLKDYLINFSRTFIYTTALNPHSMVSIIEAWKYLRDHSEIHSQLNSNIEYFINKVIEDAIPLKCQKGPIQVIPIPGNENCRKLADQWVEFGFDVRPILYPTVAKGMERIRICIHSFNNPKDIGFLAQQIQEYFSS